MNGWLWSIPVLSAGIGWMSNWIAIKLLLRSRKRQARLTQQLAKLLGKGLLSSGIIEQKISSSDNFQKIRPEAEKHVDKFLNEKLKEAFPFIGSFIGEKTFGQLKELFMNELEQIFPVIMQAYVKDLQRDIDLEQIIANKLSESTLGDAIYNNLSKEFRLLAIPGAVFGFIAGIVQLLIVLAVTD